RYVAFASMASNLLSQSVSRQRHIYLLDRQTASITLVSRGAGSPGNGPSYIPQISASGKFITYYTFASNVASNMSGSKLQVVLYDVEQQVTEQVSRNASGIEGNDHSIGGMASDDGRYVSFVSYASNLVADDANNAADVFLRDRQTGEMTIISRSESGQAGNGNVAGIPNIDAAGHSVLFVSYANNLVMGDSNGVADLYIHQSLLNLAPVANAGVDQTLSCSGSLTPVTLDASASSDPEGDALSYEWIGRFGQASGVQVTVPLSLGIHQIDLNVIDTQSNSDQDSVNITVEDTVAPAITGDTFVRLEADSRSGASHLLQTNAVDNCSAVAMSVTPHLSIYPLGNTQVNVSASDSSNNRSEKQIDVVVEDTTVPVLTTPADIHAEATEVESRVNIGQASATDIFDVTLSNNAPVAFPLGNTSVTWVAKDSNGNRSAATQNITLVDTTAPELTVPADIVTEATAVNSPVELGSPQVSDIFPTTVSHNGPAAYSLGQHVVTWTARDSSGNEVSATQQVTLQDTTAPTVQAMDIQLEATAVLTPLVLAQPAANDIFPMTFNNDAPAAYALGMTYVNWLVTDSSGNQASVQQRVMVVDTRAPQITAPADVVVEAQGELTSINIGQAQADDIFLTRVWSNAPASYPLGTTVVTWYAEDSSGNLASATQNVTVADTTPPEFVLEQLKESIWPPNRKLVEVARIHSITDNYDVTPAVEINVTMDEAQRQREERRRDEHNRHSESERLSSQQGEDSHEYSAHDYRHGGYHVWRDRKDWEVEQIGDEWIVSVRAKLRGRYRERTYTINVNVTDNSGNQASREMVVTVGREKHRH
ncbi:MAG: HYR domain-containing protein, partial [Gammaproteobacteria bacterium]|nr:HYR domain-containing protein [Gammaproteobacteria bacterium]